MIKVEKIFILFTGLVLASVLLLLASCNTNKNANNGRHITDIYNRDVSVPEKVEKIATVGSATRLCVYAGSADKLVGITEIDKTSELRPYTIPYAEKFENLPTTNNGNHINSTTVDEEKMLSLSPDVIFSTRSADECEKLQKDINIPVVGIYFQDEMFSDAVYSSIKIVGDVSNSLDHANKTIEFLKNTEQDLTSRCKGNDKKLFRGAVNFKGSKDLCGTISNYCVYKTIKANNVAEKEGINSAYDTNLEQIISWDPDYIFMDYTNSRKIQNQKEKNADAFKQVRTLNNGNAFYVAPFNNNGTNIEYGICECYYTAKILYPDEFKDVDIDTKFSEIFEAIDGKDIYPELKDKGVYFGPASF